MSVFLTAAQATPYVLPTATPPGDLYFTYQRPDGDQFVGTAANAENYLRLGFTVVGELTLSDSDSFRNAVSPGAGAPPFDGTSATEVTATPGVKATTAP